MDVTTSTFIKLLSEKQLEIIKDNIQIELTKRCITASIIKIEEVPVKMNNSSTRIELKTEKFQTVPVIFKELWLESYNSSVSLLEDNSSVEVWLGIYYSYKHFNGGSNGCKLFTLNCQCFDVDEVSDIKIN